MQRQSNTFFALHTSHCTLHTSHFALHTCTSHSTLISSQKHVSSSHLISPHLISSHPISSHMSSRQVLLNCFHLIRALIDLSHLPKVFLNSSQLFCTPESSYCQREVSCTKNNWAQKAFAHRCIYTEAFTKYFVLQSLHTALPSTTLYCKACTEHVAVLLCTTHVAQSTSQYFFVLPILRKVLPSIALYYKACTKHVPVLLYTAKLAQSTSQYYFVLSSLHKILPSTMYYKVCTKYFPVLLCTTKFAQNTS